MGGFKRISADLLKRLSPEELPKGFPRALRKKLNAEITKAIKLLEDVTVPGTVNRHKKNK